MVKEDEEITVPPLVVGLDVEEEIVLGTAYQKEDGDVFDEEPEIVVEPEDDELISISQLVCQEDEIVVMPPIEQSYPLQPEPRQSVRRDRTDEKPPTDDASLLEAKRRIAFPASKPPQTNTKATATANTAQNTTTQAEPASLARGSSDPDRNLAVALIEQDVEAQTKRSSVDKNDQNPLVVFVTQKRAVPDPKLTTASQHGLSRHSRRSTLTGGCENQSSRNNGSTTAQEPNGTAAIARPSALTRSERRQSVEEKFRLRDGTTHSTSTMNRSSFHNASCQSVQQQQIGSSLPRPNPLSRAERRQSVEEKFQLHNGRNGPTTTHAVSSVRGSASQQRNSTISRPSVLSRSERRQSLEGKFRERTEIVQTAGQRQSSQRGRSRSLLASFPGAYNYSVEPGNTTTLPEEHRNSKFYKYRTRSVQRLMDEQDRAEMGGGRSRRHSEGAVVTTTDLLATLEQPEWIAETTNTTRVGCVHVHGPGYVEGSEATYDNIDEEASRVEANPSTGTTGAILAPGQRPSCRNLAVARAVSGQSTLALPMADEITVDRQTPARKRNNMQRMIVRGGLVLTLFVILLVIIIIAIVTRNNRKAHATQTVGNTTSTSETSSKLDPIQEHLWSLLPDSTRQSIASSQESPQAKALDFLQNDPGLTNFTAARIRQRFALAAFYYSTGGPEHWDITDGWLSYKVHECQWWSRGSPSIPGETYDAATAETFQQYSSPCGATYNKNPGSVDDFTVNNIGTYEHLWQWGNGLHGSLPPELFWLSSLKSISIAPQLLELNATTLTDKRDRFLSGSLPSEIGDCTSLEVLLLANNFINGTLPPQLSQLTSLSYLRLTQNDLSGSIPEDLELLKSMRTLDLFWNRLSGSVPWSGILAMNKLVTLHLGRNSLDGRALPDSIGQLTNLQSLWLFSNDLTGRIPASIGNLKMLRSLLLGENKVGGSIPPQIGNLVNLSLIRLEENQITGSVPDSIQHLTNLQRLMLYRNLLSGTVPSQIGMLKQLYDFQWFSNSLTGKIPSEIGLCSSLAAIWIFRNHFTGSLPTSIGMLAKMLNIDVASNSFDGRLPSELALLTELKENLSLGSNSFSGWLPTEIFRLTDLAKISIDSNLISGTIPSEAGKLQGLTQLSMSKNAFTGSVPSELGQMTGLRFFDLGDNPQLTGTLPHQLLNLLTSPNSTIRRFDMCGTEVSHPVENEPQLCQLDSVCLPGC
ncbi:LRR receptor-like serine threonine-protein kinase [Seminavis robusta]|uniref:non-specific serine/threonine protein kinase n=1 Tax=Seminavis robusta TaxID=568900 RepID=A0A9N8DL98_9STRA|nr:LRR receptor-like serine threonine-protein kinase [Seminavis robusta]|eukprot:Sro204_g086030.1 LRR receptor-like serine threonine-protein kinase (1204) ;mRNA; r:83865-87476